MLFQGAGAYFCTGGNFAKYLSPVAKRHLFSGSRALVFPSIPRALRNLLLFTLHLPP